MSLGSNIRKVVTDFYLGSKIYKLSRGIKPVSAGELLDSSKCKDIRLINQQLYLLSLSKNKTEKLCYSFPQTYNSVKKNIIEPEKSVKISFELPIKNSDNAALDLPFQTEKEIKEPGETFNKHAVSHLIRIRKKKMRKHKRKKWLKKHRAEMLKRKIHASLKREATLENSLKEILSEIENYSPEKYVNQLLEDAHWEKPITHIRGFLAPKWVIDEHLKKEKEKKIIQRRIEECQK